MESKHDRTLLKILHDEKSIRNFLDAFFGFLYRCTDFYVKPSPDQKLGFPSGVAENLVVSIFRKWSTEHEDDRQQPQILGSQLPEFIQEMEVATGKGHVPEDDEPSGKNAPGIEAGGYRPPVQPSDSYNGAIREKYTWSQTITDLDVLVKIPDYLKTAKDLRVDITANGIKLATRTDILRGNDDVRKYGDESSNSEWTIIFDEELSFKTQKEESIWSMVPGKHVNIHLEKASERWWEALTKGEPNIELNKIDCSRHIDDLGLNEQMKVQELMWNHQQKLLGKSTSDHQANMVKILKKAWNAEGSPFKGSEYDPSVLNLN